MGRKQIEKLLAIEAPTISTHHLRFRCVVYEEDDDEHGIAPMIYFRVLSFNSVELRRTVAGHNTSVAVSSAHGDVLLGDFDVLQLTPENYVQFRYQHRIKQRSALDNLQRAEAKCFANSFLLSGRRLGVGGHASVYIAIKQKTNRQFACKALPLPQTNLSLDNKDESLRSTTAQRETKLLKAREGVAREYAILEKLNHPNVVSLERVICASHNIYIFQELITGGDLSSFIDQNGALSEPEAAAITFQLLKAIDYLHSNGCTHRDIKPENILMTSWRKGARVVLTDFGQARAIDGGYTAHQNANALRMSSVVGTYGYTAPEIYQQVKHSPDQKGYSKAVDIWSLGCVTAILLTGEALFNHDKDDFANAKDALSESMCRRRWSVNTIDHGRGWRDISGKAKGFVKGCLAKDETARLTAEQALLHDWLANKHYASELSAAYERAIADWRPRKQEGSLIEFIDTTDAVFGTTESQAVTSSTTEHRSKHFEAPQKAPVLPQPLTRKDKVAILPQAHPAPLPVMSRDAKGTSTANSATLRDGFDTFSLASQAGDSRTTFTYASNVSTGPLSIWQYGPPQTQATVQPLSVFRQYDSVHQSQPVLYDPTKTQLALQANPLSLDYRSGRVVNSQETQGPHGMQTTARPRKKVCR